MQILIKGINLLEVEFRKLFSEKLNQETRIKYLNTLKIHIYLIVEFTNHIEKKMSKEAQDNDLLSTSVANSKVSPQPYPFPRLSKIHHLEQK